MRERDRVSGRGVCEMKSKNEPFLALKQGNVATFEATSRRSGQRRDVRGNVATLQSVELNDVATLGGNVAT